MNESNDATTDTNDVNLGVVVNANSGEDTAFEDAATREHFAINPDDVEEGGEVTARDVTEITTQTYGSNVQESCSGYVLVSSCTLRVLPY